MHEGFTLLLFSYPLLAVPGRSALGRATDFHLNIDSSAAQATLDVTILHDEQLEWLIKRLGSEDHDEREAAIRAMARQPECSLPKLKAARKEAGAITRGWIDTAIQQVEAARSNATK